MYEYCDARIVYLNTIFENHKKKFTILNKGTVTMYWSHNVMFLTISNSTVQPCKYVSLEYIKVYTWIIIRNSYQKIPVSYQCY